MATCLLNYGAKMTIACYSFPPLGTHFRWGILTRLQVGIFKWPSGLLENRDSKYKKLVEESEFSIAILDGDVNEIPIVVSSKEGRCPFQKGECPWSKGEVYVLKMGSGDSGVWLNSYEKN